MKPPIILLAVGIALWGVGLFLLNSHSWEPLVAPISLQPDREISHTFSVDLTAEYSVEVAVSRVRPFEQLRTILEALDLTCRVEDLDGKPVAEFALKGVGSSSKDVVRIIGSFDGKKNHSYRILLKNKSDGRALSEANPRLVVREESHILTAYVTIAQLLAIPALGLISVSGIWLSAIGLSRLIKKPNQTPEPTAATPGS